MTAPDRSHQHRPGSAHDRRLLRRLLGFTGSHRLAIATTVLLLLLGVALRLVGPEIFQRVVDGPIAEAQARRGQPGFDAGALVEEVVGYALLFLLVALVMSGTNLLREWLMHRTGQRIVYSIRNRLFAHILALPVAWFDRHHVGWVVTRSTSDVDTLSELFTTGISTIVADLLTIVVIVVALVWIAPQLSVVALVVLPVMIAVSFHFRLAARRAYRATRESISRLNAFLQERLTGLDVVHLFRREQASAHRFDELNRRYYRDNMETVRHFSLFFPAVDTLAQAIRIGTLVTGAWLLFDGEITAGVLLQFVLYLNFVFDPIRELAERYNVLQAAMAAAERIFGILDTDVEGASVPVARAVPSTVDELAAPPPREVRAAAEPAAPPPREVRAAAEPAAARQPSGVGAGPRADGAPVAAPPEEVPAIAFEHVSFAYGDGPLVLDDVSFSVRRGERVAVVGHTGAGKTTLVNLLCRFHETPRGRILLHGRDIDALPHAELRSRIAIVQQDVFLFSESVAANIRMGDGAMPHERVVAAAAAVHADRFIERLPAGYDTVLAERGANLSAGQRQLLAFARALAADPEVLVLDEATSSVDSETEALIEDAIGVLMAGRTSLVIAHRLSTIVNADRILVMHKGRLHEQGSHDELMAARGLYHKLYRLHLA